MTQQSRIFSSKPMTEWLEAAQELPPITPLYSPWWNEGETCFFFGSTGVGKTLYAMQMAHQISQDKKVLYFDFEMSSRQLLQRYNNDGELVPFAENLIRVEMEKNTLIEPKKLFNAIEDEVKEHEAQVIIIDNITWLLKDGQEAKHAIPFMQKIVHLKNKYNLSVLILAHTPKRKPMSQFTKGTVTTFDNPLELADMAGSAALNNFIDSCFAIGKSRKDGSMRYFKQLKSRSSEIIHDEDNVVVCKLTKLDQGFLGFRKEGESFEYEHLVKKNDKTDRDSEILKMSKAGLSSRKIGDQLNMSHTHVQRIIKEKKGSGEGEEVSPDDLKRIRESIDKSKEMFQV